MSGDTLTGRYRVRRYARLLQPDIMVLQVEVTGWRDDYLSDRIESRDVTFWRDAVAGDPPPACFEASA